MIRSCKAGAFALAMLMKDHHETILAVAVIVAAVMAAAAGMVVVLGMALDLQGRMTFEEVSEDFTMKLCLPWQLFLYAYS